MTSQSRQNSACSRAIGPWNRVSSDDIVSSMAYPPLWSTRGSRRGLDASSRPSVTCSLHDAYMQGQNQCHDLGRLPADRERHRHQRIETPHWSGDLPALSAAVVDTAMAHADYDHGG